MHVGEKKSILFRWEAVAAAFLLILSMAVTLLPGLKVVADDNNSPDTNVVNYAGNKVLIKPSANVPVIVAGERGKNISIFYLSYFFVHPRILHSKFLVYIFLNFRIIKIQKYDIIK